MKPLRILLLLTFFSFRVSADQVFLPWFSQWKYLDNGTNQGTAWTGTAFNDASWRSAYAQLGYGDNDENTFVSYGTNPNAKYITTYFRKTVTVPNPADFTDFTLSLRRDDGAIVYVNGTEVYRNNMPTGTVSYNTYASGDASDDGGTPVTGSVATSYFNAGVNTIAVEIHQATASNADLSFDLQLTGNQASSPQLVRGPYLMTATPNSIKVRWRTAAASNSVVRYGTSQAALTSQVTDTSSVTEHIVTLTGLSPNTRYYYSIGATGTTLTGNEDNFFVTPPPAGTVKPTRIWATGDFGNGSNNSSMVRNTYLNYTGNTYTDMWIWMGDNAYSSGLDNEYQDKVFNYRYERLFRSTCIWPCPGNHDYANVGYQGSSALTTNFPYFNAFSVPQNGEAGGVPSGTPKYYSYNYANIHFISLDSYGSLNAAGSPMYNWLQSDLAANTQKWTIVYFHHAPYTKGSHNSDTETELIHMRTRINPLLENYKVDLVLSGHSHSYERSFLIKDHFGLETDFSSVNQVNAGSGDPTSPYRKANLPGGAGTVYAVVGCSGQTVGGTSSGYPHNAMYTSTVSTYGSMVIDINGDTLTAKMLTNNVAVPTVYDQFRIIKGCYSAATIDPVPPLYITSAPVTLSAQPAGGTFTGNGITGNQFDPYVAGLGVHTIQYSYTDSAGCVAESSVSIEVLEPYTTLRLKAFIEGFYRGSGTMTEIVAAGTTDLMDVWLVPADTNNSNIYTSYNTLYANGTGDFLFYDVPMGVSYYIVLHHRNSLETWSSLPVALNNDTIQYDFTLSASSAYGNRLKALGGGKFGLYSGDLDQDGLIGITDLQQSELAAGNFFTGYNVWDVTGDNFDESSDYSLVENNLFQGISVARPPGR
jgi:hypothetical protein